MSFKQLYYRVTWFFRTRRLAYCQGFTCACETASRGQPYGSGFWTLCREQQINRSSASAWMCEECADEEQIEVDAAWAEYHSGCL